ncbi:Conserved hypothetical protein [gamma proteobacterium HdN1]|nr:Conserved hypothetical protein [gamma proteobacterium HdN1]
MFRPLSLFVGLRYLRAKQRNHFISFISSATILGVMLGVAVLIVVLSVINGFDREFQQRVLGMVSHANIWSRSGIEDWPAAVKSLEQIPGVEGAAPFVRLQGMLMQQGGSTGVILMGVDPAYEARVSILPKYLEGTSLSVLSAGSFNILIGKPVAERLGLSVGDSVTLILPSPSSSSAGVSPLFQRFNVAGIFSTGSEVDQLLAYVSLGDAQPLAQLGERAQGIRLRVADLFHASTIAENAVASLRGPYWAVDWTLTHGNLYASITMVKGVMALLLIIVIVVAAFNIVSSLVMVVNDKRSDIAILRTLGAGPRTIMAIFVVQGTFVGLLGALTGTALGVGISLTISDAFRWLEGVLHQDLMQQYFVNYLPSELRVEYVLAVVLTAFCISMLATLYPAWQASKVQPAEALRYD